MTYSKRKPKKPGSRVLNNGRSGEPYSALPYASIPASMLVSAAFNALSAHAIRVLLLFHAAYHVEKELFIAQRTAGKLLRASPNTMSRAYAELEQAGFLIRLRDHIRPGGMGSAGAGKAAIYDLPGRNMGLEVTWRRSGDPGRAGWWRIHSARLRARLRTLSAGAVKVWCFMHAVDRRSDGSPAQNSPRVLRAEEVGLPAETLRLKAIELCVAGIIRVITKGGGQRPSTYALTEAECKGLKAPLVD
jgi:hypothetical protein